MRQQTDWEDSAGFIHSMSCNRFIYMFKILHVYPLLVVVLVSTCKWPLKQGCL